MDVLTWLRAQADRVLGFALVAAGAVALLIGYEKAADTRYLAEQITVLISGGLGGIFCLGAGATLLVCADIRDEWRKLDRIEAVLVHMSGALGLPPPPEPPGGTGDRPGRRLSSPVITSTALVIMAVGAMVVAGGWQASASTTTGSKAIDAAGWSSAGIIVAGIGAGALIISLKRAVKVREVAVLSPVALYGAWQEAGLRMARPGPGDSGREAAATVRYAAGLRHFHRAGCAAVAEVATDSCERAVASERLAPCPLCEP